MLVSYRLFVSTHLQEECPRTGEEVTLKFNGTVNDVSA